MKNHHYILVLSRPLGIGFLFRISTILGTLEKFLEERREGDTILAAYANSENTSQIEEQIGKVKLDHLDQTLKEKLRRLLEMYRRMFTQTTYDVGQNNIMETRIRDLSSGERCEIPHFCRKELKNSTTGFSDTLNPIY